MNEVVTKSINELISSDYIDLVLQMEELKARLEVMDAALSEEIKNYLIENNLANIETEKDGIKIKWTYVKPSIQRKANYEKLIADGLYENYVTESSKSDYVRKNVSYGEDE